MLNFEKLYLSKYDLKTIKYHVRINFKTPPHLPEAIDVIMFRDILNYNFQFLLLLSGKKVRTTSNKIQNEMYQP